MSKNLDYYCKIYKYCKFSLGSTNGNLARNQLLEKIQTFRRSLNFKCDFNHQRQSQSFSESNLWNGK